LPGGDSVLFTFNQSFTASAGSFDICASTELTTDYDTINNELCKNVVTTAMNKSTANDFRIINIIPNPAENQTTLSLYMPHAERIKYKIRDLNKQLYYEKSLSLQQGRQYININTQRYKAGVYVIQLYFKNQVTSKKLIIIK
jgi:hypothetical protein